MHPWGSKLDPAVVQRLGVLTAMFTLTQLRSLAIAFPFFLSFFYVLRLQYSNCCSDGLTVFIHIPQWFKLVLPLPMYNFTVPTHHQLLVV